MMKFVSIDYLKAFKIKTSYDVLFLAEDNSVKVGYLYTNKKGQIEVLVDVTIYKEGRVILLEPYTNIFKKCIFNIFGTVV